MAEETETVAKSVMLERLAAKDRAHSAAVQLLEAKISKLSDKLAASETAAKDAASAIAERDQLRERLESADIAAALGGVGLGGDENDGLRSAIIERWKTAPVEADAERPAFAAWLSETAPTDPLVSIHLRGPADVADPILSRNDAAPAGSAFPGAASAALNIGARAPQSAARPKLAPAALRDKMRAEMAKASVKDRRAIFERYRAEYPNG